MPKRIFSVILIILLLFMPSMSVGAYEPSGFEVNAKTAMLVCMDTDEVIYSKAENERVFPASITKIMVSILMLESEKYNPTEKIAMTEEVQRLISGTGSSVSNLQIGEEITQLDLVYTVLMSSFGDCAYLAAIYYGGSVENFIKMMNDKASELGLTGTHYQNPVGLHSEDNYTTAVDTYALTKYALKNPTFKKVCESTRYTIPPTNMSGERTISTTNFLQDNNTNYYYSYAKGVKTGFTDEAGRCLVSTASYNGYNYMCILFGCPSNAPQRVEFIDSRNLYRWAFNNFEYKQVADTDNPVCEIGVNLSMNTDFVSLYIDKAFVSVLPNEADESTITIKPIIEKQSIDAPIKKGDVLGKAEIIYAEKVLGTVDLISHEDIEKSLLLSALNGIKKFFTSSYMKVVYIILGAIVLIFIIAVIKINSGKSNKRKVKYIPYEKNNRRGKH